MRCEPFREALSAELDGEDPGLPGPELDDHLAGCADCRAWLDSAAEVTRRVRLVPAEPVPDVSAAVLAALPATRRPGVRRRRVDVGLRLLLLATGVVQLVVGLPALIGADAPMTHPMMAPVHMTHETAAWNLGLGFCFLGVAALPRLAAGALPFLLSFTAVLTWVTVGDIRAGHVSVDRAVSHVFLLLGAVLVSVLALRGRAAPHSPSTALRPRLGRLDLWARGVPTGLRAQTAGQGDVGPASAAGRVPATAQAPGTERAA